jgi:hypothetical protein
MQRVMGREGVGVIAAYRLQNRSLFARHEGRVTRAPFVIVAQQVEDPMDQEAPEFLTKSVPEISRMTPGRIDRNHDIAQQHGRTVGARPPTLPSPSRGEGEGGGERKRQHVGRSVFFPVPAIEGAYAPVGDQHQAELRAIGPRGRQDGVGCPAQPRPIDRHHALTVLQDDGHGDQ